MVLLSIETCLKCLNAYFIFLKLAFDVDMSLIEANTAKVTTFFKLL